jgi:hypothetical protein
MTPSHEVGRLPTFAALDGYGVLAGQRRGASIQLDETYFDGQLRALQHPDTESTATYRTQMLQDSKETCNGLQVQIDSVSEQNLWDESKRLRRKLQRMPEISYLVQGFPGRCFVVPEWLRTEDRLHYGSRVYLFRDDDSPEPADILQENIEAVVNDTSETFERYQGQLHGYPDCCIDFYHNRSADQPSPEWRSVDPFTDWIREEAFEADPSSVDDVFSTTLDPEEIYPFFAREFFPEPGCETANAKGKAIYEKLSGALPDRLVNNYFRLNFAYDYSVARTMVQGGDRRPAAGRLGREHLLFYLPLQDLLSGSKDR